MDVTFDDALGDELLPLVLTHLPLEDLCRLQRVCQRLRAAVVQAQGVWGALYAATWPETTFGAEGCDERGKSRDQRQGQPGQQERLGQQQQGQQQQGQAVQREGQLHSGAATKRRRDGEALFPASAAAPPAVTTRAAAQGAALSGGDVDWRARFKARFVEEARRERLKRQAKRLKAESALQVLHQEVHRLEQALAAEQRALPGLQAELAALQRARQQASSAALASVFWQPVAVQLAHGVVTDQAPLDAEAREHDLQQRVAVAQLEARKLAAALEAKRRRAAEARRKLQALLP